jgi:hypothetical protein
MATPQPSSSESGPPRNTTKWVWLDSSRSTPLSSRPSAQRVPRGQTSAPEQFPSTKTGSNLKRASMLDPLQTSPGSSHNTGSLDPGGQKVPCRQTTHDPASDPEKLPNGHGRQTLSVVCPRPVEKWPGLQRRHEPGSLAPSRALYVPAAHGRHAPFPTPSPVATVPAVHN